MKKHYLYSIAIFNLLFAMSTFAQVTERHDEIAVEVIREINLVRSNPPAYATHLETVKKYYKGNLYLSPEEGRIETYEGVTALDEVIRDLLVSKPLAPLKFSEGMSRAAMDHVYDVGLKGVTSHVGSDRSVPGMRLSRYGVWQENVGENINFGRVTPRAIVISMLVDDGVKSRGHRKNILQSKFAFIGTASGTHSKHDIMTVVVFADYYHDFFQSKNVASSNGKSNEQK